MNFERFVAELVKPLVTKPEEVVVEVVSQEDPYLTLQIIVDPDDIGRVIGKRGRIANSLRTLVFACGARYGMKIELIIDKLS